MQNRFVAGLLVLSVAVVIAACSSSTVPLGTQKAGAFIGGALTNFFGLDADDPSVRNTAREIAVSRIYDLTPVGFTIVSGSANTAAGGFGDFGGGSGTVTTGQGSQDGTLDLEVVSFDPEINNIQLHGRFTAADAQQAVDSPGASFTIVWEFSWEQDGTIYELSAEQVVSGTDWS